jgi:hypothetical protein
MEVIGELDDGTLVYAGPRVGQQNYLPMMMGPVRVNPGGALGRPLPQPMPPQPNVVPDWRGGQLAPGVNQADEGLVPLGLKGDVGNTFTAAIPTITFEGKLQKPFRGERLVVATVRTGTSATGLLLSQIFVGVDLQQGSTVALPIETLGATNAFGMRLTLMQAPPGVIISLPTTLSNNPTGSDTIFVSLFMNGRIVH